MTGSTVTPSTETSVTSAWPVRNGARLKATVSTVQRVAFATRRGRIHRDAAIVPAEVGIDVVNAQ